MLTDRDGRQVRLIDGYASPFGGVYFGPNPPHNFAAGDRVRVPGGMATVVHTDAGELFAGLFVRLDGQTIPGQWVLIEHLNRGEV